MGWSRGSHYLHGREERHCSIAQARLWCSILAAVDCAMEGCQLGLLSCSWKKDIGRSCFPADGCMQLNNLASKACFKRNLTTSTMALCWSTSAAMASTTWKDVLIFRCFGNHWGDCCLHAVIDTDVWAEKAKITHPFALSICCCCPKAVCGVYRSWAVAVWGLHFTLFVSI